MPSLDGFCPPVVSLGSLSMFSSRLTREPDLTLYPTITRVSLIPERYSLWGAGLRHLGWLCPWASPSHWQNTKRSGQGVHEQHRPKSQETSDRKRPPWPKGTARLCVTGIAFTPKDHSLNLKK